MSEKRIPLVAGCARIEKMIVERGVAAIERVETISENATDHPAPVAGLLATELASHRSRHSPSDSRARILAARR